MKRSHFITAFVLSALMLSLTVPTLFAQGNGNGRGNNSGAAAVVAGDLTEAESAELLYMREEEKMARDVYLTLGETWNLQVFQNIAQSEQKHMDSILALIEAYELADPVGDNAVGVFANEDLQALYDQLVESGSQSVSDALMAGGAIEEIDILDLQAAIANTDKANLQQVYTNLLNGSYNHLRAFSTNLMVQTGEVYVPQYMTADEYGAVIAANGARGNGNQGNGNAGRRGNGTGNSGQYGSQGGNFNGGQGNCNHAGGMNGQNN